MTSSYDELLLNVALQLVYQMKLDKGFLPMNFICQSAIVQVNYQTADLLLKAEILLLLDITKEPAENFEEQVAAPSCLLLASSHPVGLPCIKLIM